MNAARWTARAFDLQRAAANRSDQEHLRRKKYQLTGVAALETVAVSEGREELRKVWRAVVRPGWQRHLDRLNEKIREEIRRRLALLKQAWSLQAER